MSYPVLMVPAGDVIPILFATYAGSTGASVTMTGLAVTDIEIYKDGSITQRASDAGYTLLDTDGIDFDGLTGIHGFSIDTGDNTDAGFYAVGSWFTVVVSAVTVDGQTVSFIAAMFRLMAAEGVAGVPDVNTTHISDTAQTANDVGADVDAILVDTGTTLQGELDAIEAAVITNAAGVDIAADIIAIKAETAAILADTGTDLPATLATIAGYLDTEIAAILADTNELQTDWANGGRLDLLIDAIKAVTDLLTAAHSEPTGVPAANETPLDKLAYLYMALRNKVTVTATKKTFYDDGDAAEWEKDLSDDGTTYQETEANAI